MSRSLKKAPYVEEKLYSRICAMNANGEKKVLKTWCAPSCFWSCNPEQAYPKA